MTTSTTFAELSAKMEELQTEIDHTAKMLIRRDIELMSANEELQALDRAKSEFVSTAAHQLRTPLTSINWFAEILLADTTLTDEQRAHITNIYSSGRRMAELISALLDTSRLELGTSTLQPTTLNPQKLIQTIIADLAGTHKAKNITHIAQWDTAPTHITSDKRLLELILHNLLSNAFKYTPAEGTVTTTISQSDTTTTFTVEDTGYGIPEDEQERVFQKFYRASNISDGYDGTGLGLHIVTMAVKKLGGTLSFTSEVDRGTTFTVALPEITTEPSTDSITD